MVNQIAQDDQLSRLPALAQLGDALQIRPFAVAGDGNAMGLQMIRFTQVHIGDEQQPVLLHPNSLLGQKRQGVLVPLEVADAHIPALSASFLNSGEFMICPQTISLPYGVW